MLMEETGHSIIHSFGHIPFCDGLVLSTLHFIEIHFECGHILNIGLYCTLRLPLSL